MFFLTSFECICWNMTKCVSGLWTYLILALLSKLPQFFLLKRWQGLGCSSSSRTAGGMLFGPLTTLPSSRDPPSYQTWGSRQRVESCSWPFPAQKERCERLYASTGARFWHSVWFSWPASRTSANYQDVVQMARTKRNWHTLPRSQQWVYRCI